ncbi:MAG: autoinducer binding domain-containing protein [Gammaproteobacteria bacterium]|nr:autoinducer binding domain-containing protein [Gammaproteobacteria bacterium]
MEQDSMENLVVRMERCESVLEGVEILKRSAAVCGLQRNAVVEDYSTNDLVSDVSDVTLAESFGWTEDAIRNWVKGRMTLISPVGAVCRFARRPFAFRPAASRLPGVASLEVPQKRVMDFLVINGITGCIVTPVHQPLGRVGAVVWMGEDEDTDFDGVLMRNERHFFMLGHYFMAVVARRRGELAAQTITPNLSQREIECLTWVALGKTEKEVGMILDRSPTTIRFHVDNAVRKLDASNRAQAVAKAAQLGVIGPVV